MGRLGSHPHVVTVSDRGEEAGQAYMVTELMGGGNVEGLVEDAPDQRIPRERAINIARESCQGLGVAHSRGIVHRDNYGLAVSLDRYRVTTKGMIAGTLTLILPASSRE